MGSFDTHRLITDITDPVLQSEKLLYRLNVAWENSKSYRDFQQYNNLLTISANRRFTGFLSLNASYSRTDFNQNFIETRSLNRFTDDGTELIRAVNDRVTDAGSDFITTYFVGKFNTGAKIKHEAVLGYDYFNSKQNGVTRSASGEANGVPNLVFKNRVVYQSLADLQKNISPVTMGYNMNNSYNAFYIQNLIRVGEKLSVLLGLRYEDLKQENLQGDGIDFTEAVDNTIFLPRFGATYKLNKNVNLFVSYSEAFNQQSVPSTVNSTNPGENFDPLASNQIEFGTKTSFFNERLLAQASFYHIKQSGRLMENPNYSGGLIQMIQLGEEISEGIELDITGRIAPSLSLTANYAYNQVEILKENSEQVTILNLENNNPQHTAGFWGKYTIAEGIFQELGFGLGGMYTSQSQAYDPSNNLLDNNIVFPAYFTIKGAVYYQYRSLKFAFNLNNILDEKYFIGGLNSGRVYPGAPRSAMATVSYTFY